MKTVFALLIAALALPSFAEAARKPRPVCLFGDSTADLSDKLEAKGNDKILFEGELLSFSKPSRLKGLSKAEKELIVQAQGETAFGGKGTQQQILEAFVSAEGYMHYFSHNDGREFVSVASYPGDNEFGLIFEIKSGRGRGEFEVLDVAAVISDSDLEDCKVSQ